MLDDAIPAQQEIGIRLGLRVLTSCDEFWICGERISRGMSSETAEAKRLGILSEACQQNRYKSSAV